VAKKSSTKKSAKSKRKTSSRRATGSSSSAKARSANKSRKPKKSQPVKHKKKSSKTDLDKVTIDRRAGSERRKISTPTTADGHNIERRKKVSRRRQIDPTTCERDYTDEEIEFMRALEQYKRTSGRMFPTCSEVLEVLRDLGYQKSTPREPVETTIELVS